MIHFSFPDVFLLRATEKRELSSAKTLEFYDKPVSKSLMWNKNNKEQRIKPWGTPAFTAAHLEDCPFRATF